NRPLRAGAGKSTARKLSEWGARLKGGRRPMSHECSTKRGARVKFALVAVAACALAPATASAAWEPTRTVEIIVPAGTGGGADQMARVVQGIVTKHNLMKQPMVVINKAGGAGGEGFLDVKNSKGNPHKLIITLS